VVCFFFFFFVIIFLSMQLYFLFLFMIFELLGFSRVGRENLLTILIIFVDASMICVNDYLKTPRCYNSFDFKYFR
jgi:hypothetical protein